MKTILALLKYILPIIIVIYAFSVNALAGLIFLLLFLSILIYTKRASFYGLIGSMKYTRGALDEALVWFKRSCETKKASPGTIISYGYVLLKTGHPEEAEKVLDSLLKSNTGMNNLRYAKSNLALVYWKTGRLDQAVAILEEVIAEYTTSTIYGSLGYLLILQGDLDKALAFNREAYEYNNNNAIIADNLAQNYFLKGMYPEAGETFEKLMALRPSFPEAYYNYALLLIELDQKDKAAEMLEKAASSVFSYLSDITPEMISAKLTEIRGEAELEDGSEEMDHSEDGDAAE